MNQPQRPRRRGTSSRAEMLAKRSKPPAVNPAPPGPVGGQYKPLTDIQISQIYDTSMRMLGELGMGEAPQALTDQAIGCGATINELGRLCFPRSMVEDIIDGACKSFLFHGRDPQYSFEVGGDQDSSTNLASTDNETVGVRLKRRGYPDNPWGSHYNEVIS